MIVAAEEDGPRQGVGPEADADVVEACVEAVPPARAAHSEVSSEPGAART